MRRDRVPELMDDPGLEAASHEAALRGLQRANRLLGTARRLETAIAGRNSGLSTSVLDLGAGGGDILERLSQSFQADACVDPASHAGGSDPSRPAYLAVDASVRALQLARSWRSSAIRWIGADARLLPLRDNSMDWVISSLFLHHLDPPDVVAVLREAVRVCRTGIVMVDLARSRIAWALTWLFTRLASRSHVFHVDGPRSVRAAFRRYELASMAMQAGMIGVQVQSIFPFRLLLIWRKPPTADGVSPP